MNTYLCMRFLVFLHVYMHVFVWVRLCTDPHEDKFRCFQRIYCISLLLS